MAVEDFSKLKWFWAEILLPNTHQYIIKHLFQHFRPWIHQIKICTSIQVGTRISQLLKLWYGFDRAFIAEHAASWIVHFH
jgi:hypothetical protein